MSSGGLTTARHSSNPNHVPKDENKLYLMQAKRHADVSKGPGDAPYFRSAGEYSDASSTLKARFW